MKLRRMMASVLIFTVTIGFLSAVWPITAKASDPVVVVLDPGHGGSEGGAVSVTGALEKDLNLKISKYTKAALERYPNVTVYMTRTTDEQVGLTQRAERASEYGADIFISQHLNSSTNESAVGAEVYVSNLEQFYSSLKVFGEKVLKELSALGLTNRGVKVRLSQNGSTHEATGETADYYAVIAASANRNIPAAIIEHAFLSNAEEFETYLSTDAKLKALGEADAAAIASYFGLTGAQAEEGVNISYQTHIQNMGWQGVVYNGAVSGTSGKFLRLEAIKINVSGDEKLGIEYSTHIQNIGWQEWKQDGDLSGTSGRAFRLEAIRIRLTGENADKYDVYYRVHAQDYGWLDWAKNGTAAGTAGYAKRLESIEIQVVDKGAAAPGPTSRCYVGIPAEVSYQTYVESKGWLPVVKDGATSGTVGQGLRMEGLKMNLANLPCSGSVRYRAHLQNKGWVDYVSGGELTGTEGTGTRLEAIQIELAGEAKENYDIYYRVHSQQFGWLDWAKNGESAGTAGYGFRVEGVEVKLVAKGAAAPGSTIRPFAQKPAEPAAETQAAETAVTKTAAETAAETTALENQAAEETAIEEVVSEE